MGLCKIRDRGELEPRFSENGAFSKEISPSDGILKELIFDYRGDHDTLITTAQTDGEAEIFTSLQVTFPRRNLPSIIWNVLPRDLKFLTQLMERQAVLTANPLADLGVHEGMFKIPLALPPHLTRNPNAWGLDTRELSGPIVIEGTYGSNTSIGTGSTGIRHVTRISTCIEQRTGRPAPLLVLAGQQNRITHDTAARAGPTTIQIGNIQALWALMLRQHDALPISAQRPDGLITRFVVEHSDLNEMANELFAVQKKRAGLFFGLPAADLPSGIVIQVFAEGGVINEMPSMEGGRKLTLIHDSSEATPTGITDVVPAAGDAVYAIAIGAQFTALGQQLDRQTGGPAARR